VEKSAYLDAMGITRWSESINVQQSYIILMDKVEDGALFHPILTRVLQLIACPVERCTITSVISKNANVIWDLRRVKIPKVIASLSSAPLSVLEQGSDKKRQLWQQIIENQEAIAKQ